MSESTRNALIRLMREHSLSHADVVGLLPVSGSTVASWLVGAHTTRHRLMPATAMELLKLKLAARNVSLP